MPANVTDLEKRLWDAADELRANSKLKASEYGEPVLGPLFLRYADARFNEAEKRLRGSVTGRRGQLSKYHFQAEGVELALFDLLTKPEPQVTKKEEADVKKVVRELLEVLKAEKLGLDWRKRQRSKAAVRAFIEIELNKLPPAYDDDDLWQQKCELAFQHIFDAYPGEGRSLYVA